MLILGNKNHDVHLGEKGVENENEFYFRLELELHSYFHFTFAFLKDFENFDNFDHIFCHNFEPFSIVKSWYDPVGQQI